MSDCKNHNYVFNDSIFLIILLFHEHSFVHKFQVFLSNTNNLHSDKNTWNHTTPIFKLLYDFK